MTSDRLEYLIDCQRRQMEQAETELERRYAWAWMTVLEDLGHSITPCSTQNGATKFEGAN